LSVAVTTGKVEIKGWGPDDLMEKFGEAEKRGELFSFISICGTCLTPYKEGNATLYSLILSREDPASEIILEGFSISGLLEFMENQTELNCMIVFRGEFALEKTLSPGNKKLYTISIKEIK